MLNEFFKPTDSLPGIQSACRTVLTQGSGSPLTGSYNNGLLSIVDFDLGNKIMGRWMPIVGMKATAIAFTGFGDVFYWASNGVNFLEVQRGATEFIDSEAVWFLSEFLVNPDVLENVLRRSQFDQVVAVHGPLEYSEVYILEPWLMLGGREDVANYKKGNVEAYLDLVAQTLTNRR